MKSTESAVVTIITPYRNAACFLPGFARMLQEQRYCKWRCILIDDRSSDEGPEVVSKLGAVDRRFRGISLKGRKESQGPAEARSYGLMEVDTPLVAFCDADDIWHPEKLQKQVLFHQKYELDLSVTGYGRFIDSTEPDLLSWRCPPKTISYKGLLGGNPLPMLTVVVRTELVRNGFPTCMHEDFALWLELSRRYPSLQYGCLPEGLAFYRIHRENHTSNKKDMMIWANNVFLEHGLTRGERYIALLRWCIYQIRQFWQDIVSVSFKHPKIYQLLVQPPVHLRRAG